VSHIMERDELLRGFWCHSHSRPDAGEQHQFDYSSRDYGATRQGSNHNSDEKSHSLLGIEPS
jgi:hypothetical protein